MRVILVLLLSLVAFSAPLLAAVYDYSADPDSGDTYSTAWFRVYVPDTAEVIRGVYFYVDPFNADSRYIVDDPWFRALCDRADFSLMGARLDDVHMESGIGDAVLEALAAFSGMSAHPEFIFTTLFFDGWSWGGQFSYHFTVWSPDRVLGFVTQKGGYHDTGDAGDAILVPGYMFIGENDLDYRIKNLTGIFEAHRPLGARWILAMQPGGGHERIVDRTLLDRYFETVIDLRLPATIPLDAPVELIVIEEASSWLGDRSSFEVGAFECYDEEIGAACWCPSRDVSTDWQAFVSDGAVTDTIPCAPLRVAADRPSPLAMALLSPLSPNPFDALTTATFLVQTEGLVRIGVYSLDGRLVRALLNARRGPGSHVVRWDGTDDDGRPAAAGAYVCRLSMGDEIIARRIVLLR